ncbi:MAG: hypothetical protein ACR2GP_09220 [Burkholderiaceae bacterium]
MEPLLVMQTATWLLVITALGGLAMAGIRFGQNKNPPSWLAMLHGFLAGAAITLLLYAALTVGLPRMAVWALVLFLLAAAGGVFLNLGYQLKNLPLPKAVVMVHAVIAVIGFVLLLTATFSRS